MRRSRTCGWEVKPSLHRFIDPDVIHYPERFAQEALGHNRKAVHRACAKRALMKLPSLEEYEKKNESPAPGAGSSPQITCSTQRERGGRVSIPGK